MLFSVNSFAGSKASLDIWKRDPYNYGLCGHCAELISTPVYKDRPDFYPYNLRAQSGYYTINLTGPKGTAVTLFGREDFETESGYLVVVKEDDLDIEIMELESFPADKWTTVEQEKGGSYSVFYKPHPNFKSLIASIQWGKGPQATTGN